MGVIETLICLFVLVVIGRVLYMKLRPKLRARGVGRLRMCPSCGLITPRAKSCCLECGTAFNR